MDFLKSLEAIVAVPFGWVLNTLYSYVTHDYALALILFALIVQLILLPITAKSKKSMMKMSRIQPKLNAVREKYANDQQKQQEAIQQIQKEEGVGMGCGGCLWSLLPLLLLIPLYSVIRDPLTYMLGASKEIIEGVYENGELVTQGIKQIMEANFPDVVSQNAQNLQILYCQYLHDYPELFKDIPEISQRTLNGVNFRVFGPSGINMGLVPSWQFWTAAFWQDWRNIVAALVPVISAGSQIFQSWISRKMSDSLVTNEKGVQDKEEAEKAQTAQTGKMMMYMMPAMSLFIGFSVPVSFSLYWFVGGMIRTVEDVILTKHYRKAYDAEDAERLKKTMEKDAEEAEKERIRAEKRAANPDGITENTSKKKMQQKKQAEEAAAKAAAKKEYDARKGIVEEQPEEKKPLSGIADRPYCKGRAYDPNRYTNTEEE